MTAKTQEQGWETSTRTTTGPSAGAAAYEDQGQGGTVPVELHLLGPVELLVARHPVNLGPPKQRAVLAMLAMEVGRPVPVRTLVDRLWDHPPAAARSSLSAHIARLRTLFRRLHEQDGVHLGIYMESGGYVLDGTALSTDLARYRVLAAGARDGALDPDRRVNLCRAALALWRGEPLTNISGEWVARVRVTLVQQHLSLLVHWAQLELDLGRPGAVVDELEEITEHHPLAEHLTGVLMQALAMTGREAEALDRYASIRQRLISELGTEPGLHVNQIHAEILRNELPMQRRPERLVRRVPFHLPPDVGNFIGREPELSRLQELILPSGDGLAASVCVISGTAGVGKTALAVHWAHQVRDLFPDGQLYIDLRGFGPHHHPTPPADVLATFLRALEGDNVRLPQDLEERTGRYRSVMDRRRALVILDNASSTEQVRALLPGASGCLTIVTSRESLSGLVARDTARRVTLDLLSVEQSVELLRALLGSPAEEEIEATTQLALRCARLPLALRVAAERAAARPLVPLSEMVDEAAGSEQWLDVLGAADDEVTGLRTVFFWSYRNLDEGEARAFRLLGAQPGNDLSESAAAALLGLDLRAARQHLAKLVRANLATEVKGHRYGMHDLLRAYARELTAAKDEDAEAMRRLLDYYLSCACAAMRAIRPFDSPEISADGCDGQADSLPDPATAIRWLEAERHNLMATLAFAVRSGRLRYAARLPVLIRHFFEMRGHYTDALQAQQHALTAAPS